jgi:hypothetical protein
MPQGVFEGFARLADFIFYKCEIQQINQLMKQKKNWYDILRPTLVLIIKNKHFP